MIERGVAGQDETDLDLLAEHLEAEYRATESTIFWDLAFLVSGRFEGMG